MTITKTYAPDKYAGDGVQVDFPVTFDFLDSGNIKATVTDTTGVDTALVAGVDYSVTGATLTTTVPVASGSRLTIWLDADYLQDTDWKNTGNYNLETLERAMDKAAVERQILKEVLSRAVTVPLTSDDTPENYLGQVREASDSAASSANDAAQSAIDAAAAANSMAGEFYEEVVSDSPKQTFDLPWYVDASKKGLVVELDGVTQAPSAFSLVDSNGDPVLTGPVSRVKLDAAATVGTTVVVRSAITDAASLAPYTSEVSLSDWGAIESAINAISTLERTLIVDQGVTLSANVTVPRNITLRVVRGGYFNGPHSLTIGGGLISEKEHIFRGGVDVTGGGLVAQAFPEWWGAVPDGISDCTQAIQSAVDFCGQSGMTSLQFSAGVYLITSAIRIEQSNLHMRGAGSEIGIGGVSYYQTTISWGGGANGIMFHFNEDESGWIYGGVVERISFEGNTTRDSADFTYDKANGIKGIYAYQTTDMVIDKCLFETVDVGIHTVAGCWGWVFDTCTVNRFKFAGFIFTKNANNYDLRNCGFRHNADPADYLPHASVDIGVEGLCANIAMYNCVFEASGVDYQIDARNVDALALLGGYFETRTHGTPQAMVRLGDTGKPVKGCTIQGVYFNGTDNGNYVFDMPVENDTIHIHGNVFKRVNTSIIKNDAGVIKGHFGNNQLGINCPKVFGGTYGARKGWNDSSFVQVRLEDDTAIEITPPVNWPVEPTSSLDAAGLITVFTKGNGGHGGTFYYDCAGTSFIKILASMGQAVILTDAILTGTTGADGKLTISASTATGLIYIENRLGSTANVVFKLHEPTGSDFTF